MASFNDFDRMMRNESKVIYKGVEMTIKQRDALIRKEKRLSGIQSRNSKVIPLLAPRVVILAKGFKLAKTTEAYYHNGYRQWGNIWKTIAQNPLIEPHFISFISAYYDANKALKMIENIAKKNDKDIFQYIEKLAYKIDDMASSISKISDSVIEAGIYANPTYNGKECVYGDGRRLGIRTLCSRVSENMAYAKKAVTELLSMVTDGIDVMEYDANSKKTITFVKA